MKNITHKYETERTATASAFVSMPAELRERVRRRDTEKGDALEIARVAAVMGAKKTWEIIPFCHPLLITRVDVDYDFVDAGIRVDVTASAVATTGVEMEAMTAAACCALTLYDMLKPYDAAVEITYTRLESKRGGKSDLGPRHLDPPLRAAVLCVSQAVLDGKKDDAAGDAVREQLERVGAELVVDEVLGADPAALSEQLIRLVEGSVELIVTVGGTGVGTDDFVVDVVRPLLDKELPGVAEAARSYGLRRTPRAMLSRSIAGIAGRTLIYTAPGSTSGARDSLTAIIAELTHAVDVVRKQQRGGGA